MHRQRTRSLEPITKPVVFSTQHRQDLRIPKQNEDFSRQGIDLPSDAREFSQKPMEISKSSPLPSFPKNSPTSRARIPRNLHKNAWNLKEWGKDRPEKLNFLQRLEFQDLLGKEGNLFPRNFIFPHSLSTYKLRMSYREEFCSLYPEIVVSCWQRRPCFFREITESTSEHDRLYSCTCLGNGVLKRSVEKNLQNSREFWLKTEKCGKIGFGSSDVEGSGSPRAFIWLCVDILVEVPSNDGHGLRI